MYQVKLEAVEPKDKTQINEVAKAVQIQEYKYLEWIQTWIPITHKEDQQNMVKVLELEWELELEPGLDPDPEKMLELVRKMMEIGWAVNQAKMSELARMTIKIGSVM